MFIWISAYLISMTSSDNKAYPVMMARYFLIFLNLFFIVMNVEFVLIIIVYRHAILWICRHVMSLSPLSLRAEWEIIQRPIYKLVMFTLRWKFCVLRAIFVLILVALLMTTHTIHSDINFLFSETSLNVYIYIYYLKCNLILVT